MQEALMNDIRKTTKNLGYMGIFFFCLSISALFLRSLSSASFLQNLSWGATIAFYTITPLFVILGLFLIYVGLYVNDRRGKEFIHCLNNDPKKIKEIYFQIMQGQEKPKRIRLSDGIPAEGTLYMIILYHESNQYQISISLANAQQIFEYVKTQASHLNIE
ncbi:hypothetical protein [Candidatus Uabimicrobium amorphum]|uniref:Uncharacterized protein n=1 Tax=Uabimicrobium amorphum TaxID=2596890 RepID=A0A5S9IJC3_UABAM|nr:hypothetical protein [Candidatus Uabimicrobium amorphum]BBM82451.1 hypothetical protein UABAM_00794 [Candidatus Uabimicrobium amorphum]